MKLGPITVFLFRDSEGFASAISQSLNPNPSSSLTRIDHSFELSLDSYGIKDLTASGNILHYVDNHDIYKVSIVIMEHYEPPVLACALNEVLNKIVGEDPSTTPTLLVPFLVESSKVKGQHKPLRSDENRALTYGIQVGQITDTTQTLLKKTRELPSSLQIQNEHFACLLHFLRVMKLPSFFLIGQTSQYLDNKSTEQYKAICEIGEILASSTGLQFSEDKVIWNPKRASKESKEPWRDLYG